MRITRVIVINKDHREEIIILRREVTEVDQDRIEGRKNLMREIRRRNISIIISIIIRNIIKKEIIQVLMRKERRSIQRRKKKRKRSIRKEMFHLQNHHHCLCRMNRILL